MIDSFATTKDGLRLFFKDWGPKYAQSIVFSHGWPLSADDWDAQLLFFLQHGYRVIAHDRRGHGRSTQTNDGHDMDHYADDRPSLHTSISSMRSHVGHSTGGGEVVHYLARHGEGRVAKAVLITAVPPIMVKTASNPGGLDKSVFDGLQPALAATGVSRADSLGPCRSATDRWFAAAARASGPRGSRRPRFEPHPASQSPPSPKSVRS